MKVLPIFIATLALTPFIAADMNSTVVIAKDVTVGNKVNRIAQSTTVLVQGQNPGSGVIIDQDPKTNTYYVLTAKHVVETPDEYEVVTPDRQRYLLQESSIKRIPNLDLALVSFRSDRSYPIAPISLKPPTEIGDRIFVAGWPFGAAVLPHEYYFTAGDIASLSHRTLEGGYQMIYTNTTHQGMSGGPIFNTNGQLVGIHGQAEGREVYVPETGDLVRVKAGLNLGIPIHQFIKAQPSTGPIPPTIAVQPEPQPPVTPPPIVTPPVATPPPPRPPQVISPPSALPERATPNNPIVLAAQPSSNIQFVRPPQLIKSSTTEKTVSQLGARYFFTIEVPPDAGRGLEQIDFILKLGVNYPRFTTQGSKVFLGQSKKGDEIPVQFVISDPTTRTVTVSLERPIMPGQTATVMLKNVKNPSVGTTYQYEVRGHAAQSQGKGQYIGLGRIEIRPRVKF